MNIHVIIVNYNAGDALRRCVQAVHASSRGARITLVDNASGDGSAEQLRNLYGDRQGIEFLFNASNLGFAPAVNAIARRSTADWLLVLNPDCIVESGTIERLVAALQEDRLAALAGPAVRDVNGRMQRATVRRFPTPKNSLMTASGLWRLGRWFPSFRGIEIKASEISGEAVPCEERWTSLHCSRRTVHEARARASTGSACSCSGGWGTRCSPCPCSSA